MKPKINILKYFLDCTIKFPCIYVKDLFEDKCKWITIVQFAAIRGRYKKIAFLKIKKIK